MAVFFGVWGDTTKLNKQKSGKAYNGDGEYWEHKTESEFSRALYVGVNHFADEIGRVNQKKSKDSELHGYRTARHFGKIDDDRIHADKRSNDRTDNEPWFSEKDQTDLCQQFYAGYQYREAKRWINGKDLKIFDALFFIVMFRFVFFQEVKS